MNPPSAEPKTTLQMRRLFPAPRERVFRAWIEPETLQQWFRPRGLQLSVSRLEAQVGGTFQFESKAPDGTLILTTGQYLEINFPEKLVFTWVVNANKDERETRVTLEFIEQGASTEVILTHDRFAKDMDTSIFEKGWGSVLELLGQVVALP